MSTVEPKIFEQLDDVARRAKRLRWIYGVGSFFFVLLLSVVLTSLLDYGFSVRDSAVRGGLTLAVIVLTSWAFVRFVYPAWRYRPTRLDVARRVEHFFPNLGNRLSTAVALLEAEAAKASLADGAAPADESMTQLTIEQAAGAVARLSVRDALNQAPAKRMFRWLLVGLMVIVGFVMLAPRESRIAVRRLVAPTAGPQWPRRNNLVWRRAVGKAAAGQDVELELADRFDRRLPSDLVFQVRRQLPTGELQMEQREMTLTDRGTAVVTWNNVVASMEYRAVGGDDDRLPWRKLIVVPATGIESVTTTVHPPDYSGFAPYQVTRPTVTALTGSRIFVELRVNRPLLTASLHGPSSVFGADRSVVGRVSRDLLHVTFDLTGDPWSLLSSGRLDGTLVDSEGVSVPVSIAQVVVTSDLPPAITWECDVVRRVVTPEGKIPLRVRSEDDLRLKAIRVQVERSVDWNDADRSPLDEEPGQKEPGQKEPGQKELGEGAIGDGPLGLESSPRRNAPMNRQSSAQSRTKLKIGSAGTIAGQTGPPNPAATSPSSVNPSNDREAEQAGVLWQGPEEAPSRPWSLPLEPHWRVDRWTLDAAQWKLRVGDELTLIGNAEDYRGGLGSDRLTWTVVSPAELESILRGQQDQALQYLVDAADRQRAATERIGRAVSGAADMTQAVDLAGVDSRNAEQTLAQRVLPLLADSLQTRRYNGLRDADLDRRIQASISQLSSLVYEDFVALHDTVDQWRRDDAAQQPRRLQEIDRLGKQVQRDLSELVESLSIWNRRESAGQGGEALLRDQQSLRDETEQFRLESLGQSRDERQRRQQQLADRQGELAERFDRWLNEIEDLADGDEAAFGKIKDDAFAGGISSRMRETVLKIRRGALGAAAEQQTRLIEDLAGLTGQLSAPSATSANQISTQQVVQRIEGLLRSQLELNQATAAQSDVAATDRNVAELAAEQRRIAEGIALLSDESPALATLGAIAVLAAETADSLARERVDAAVLADQKTVAKSLASFLTSAAQEAGQGADAGTPAQDDNRQHEPQSDTAGPTVSDWKVIHELQEAVRKQTVAIDKAAPTEQAAQLATVSRRQTHLAEIVGRWVLDSRAADAVTSGRSDDGSAKDAQADDTETDGVEANATINKKSPQPSGDDQPSQAPVDKRDTPPSDSLLNDLLDLPPADASSSTPGPATSATSPPSARVDSPADATVDGSAVGSVPPSEQAGEDLGQRSNWEEIPQLMQSAADRLNGGLTGSQTQAIQQQILQRIADQIAQAQQAGSSAGNENPAGEPSGRSDGSEPGGENNGGGTQGGSGGASASDGGVASQPPADMKIDQRVWAQLPARVREELRNSPVERFLPRYQFEIEQYYRRLSEEKSLP